MTGQGTVLLHLARTAIAEAFGAAALKLPREGWLLEKRAVFVTLTKAGELRGCVGQIAARFPLHEAVRHAARSAAFHDGRFPPVMEAEFDDLHIEVSVLSDLEPLAAASHDELLAQLRPGVDGLVLSHEYRSGVFIPEVWKQLPDPSDFVAHLKRKAGLPQGWLPGTRAERFTAQIWAEEGR